MNPIRVAARGFSLFTHSPVWRSTLSVGLQRIQPFSTTPAGAPTSFLKIVTQSPRLAMVSQVWKTVMQPHTLSPDQLLSQPVTKWNLFAQWNLLRCLKEHVSTLDSATVLGLGKQLKTQWALNRFLILLIQSGREELIPEILKSAGLKLPMNSDLLKLLVINGASHQIVSTVLSQQEIYFYPEVLIPHFFQPAYFDLIPDAIVRGVFSPVQIHLLLQIFLQKKVPSSYIVLLFSKNTSHLYLKENLKLLFDASYQECIPEIFEQNPPPNDKLLPLLKLFIQHELSDLYIGALLKKGARSLQFNEIIQLLIQSSRHTALAEVLQTIKLELYDFTNLINLFLKNRVPVSLMQNLCHRALVEHTTTTIAAHVLKLIFYTQSEELLTFARTHIPTQVLIRRISPSDLPESLTKEQMGIFSSLMSEWNGEDQDAFLSQLFSISAQPTHLQTAISLLHSSFAVLELANILLGAAIRSTNTPLIEEIFNVYPEATTTLHADPKDHSLLPVILNNNQELLPLLVRHQKLPFVADSERFLEPLVAHAHALNRIQLLQPLFDHYQTSEPAVVKRLECSFYDSPSTLREAIPLLATELRHYSRDPDLILRHFLAARSYGLELDPILCWKEGNTFKESAFFTLFTLINVDPPEKGTAATFEHAIASAVDQLDSPTLEIAERLYLYIRSTFLSEETKHLVVDVSLDSLKPVNEGLLLPASSYIQIAGNCTVKNLKTVFNHVQDGNFAIFLKGFKGGFRINGHASYLQVFQAPSKGYFVLHHNTGDQSNSHPKDPSNHYIYPDPLYFKDRETLTVFLRKNGDEHFTIEDFTELYQNSPARLMTNPSLLKTMETSDRKIAELLLTKGSPRTTPLYNTLTLNQKKFSKALLKFHPKGEQLLSQESILEAKKQLIYGKATLTQFHLVLDKDLDWILSPTTRSLLSTPHAKRNLNSLYAKSKNPLINSLLRKLSS